MGYLTIVMGKLNHDLTVFPHWESWLIREIIAFMAEPFRLVNYCSLIDPELYRYLWSNDMDGKPGIPVA